MGHRKLGKGQVHVREKLTLPQAVCVVLIVIGIAGLKLLAKE